MSEEGFVEVAVEPRHHPRLENTFVRVFDFQLRPGETTLYHRHDVDTLCVAIEPATILDQPFGQAPAHDCTSWPSGIAWCRDYGSDPVIHRVTNAGEAEIRLIGAEVRASPDRNAPHALQAPAYELKYEDTRIRVYRLDLAPGETTGMVDYDFSALFVAVCPARLALRTTSRSWDQQVEAGDVHWHEGSTQIEFSNRGSEGFRAYLAEWL